MSNLEYTIYVLEQKNKHLEQMIEWIKEAHGNSVTTEYTGDESPWELKEYIDEQIENYKQIK
ncbi:hypothetical protein [Flavobacterium facile]|uniref:hypothetical protein n=1 Tax=Flavobacterium facile TaxID=2893174 RepID=UPI002E7A5212|nr:hypothetical protein [Flavobacterium sp. T-12]